MPWSGQLSRSRPVNANVGVNVVVLKLLGGDMASTTGTWFGMVNVTGADIGTPSHENRPKP